MLKNRAIETQLFLGQIVGFLARIQTHTAGHGIGGQKSNQEEHEQRDADELHDRDEQPAYDKPRDHVLTRALPILAAEPSHNYGQWRVHRPYLTLVLEKRSPREPI